MNVDEAIETRIEIREYGDEPVDDEKRMILNAGRLAPSGRNLQHWHFVLVGDERRALGGLPRPVPDADRHVALFSAGPARRLAELDYVLGECLHPALRERSRDENDVWRARLSFDAGGEGVGVRLAVDPEPASE